MIYVHVVCKAFSLLYQIIYNSTDMILPFNDSDEEIYDFLPKAINFNVTVKRLANYASRSNWSVDYLEDLDTSEYPFPNVLWHKKSPQEIAIKCCLMLFVGVIGIFLNTIILTIIAKNRWLWTASHYLVANLALVDMLTLLVCPWLWLARDFHQQYILGNFGCRFEGFLQAKFLLNSVGAVMLVSYDRLAAAALNADARITKAAAPKLIFCTWICASGLSLPWILKRTYIERQWLDYLETFCVEDIVFMTPYWHIITTILVWVPIGLMVVAYGAIMWRLERSARALQTQGGGKLWRGRGKAMRITGCVLLAAVVCRVPYTALHYWRNHLIVEINAVDGAYSKMWWAANFLIYVNCTINPLIYGFTNIRFRRAMDMTPGVSCFKFGSWCCVCTVLKKKVIQEEDKNTEKIFVIDSTPKQNKKITYLIKNMLHINKDTLVFSVPKTDEISNKLPTRITPLKNENIL